MFGSRLVTTEGTEVEILHPGKHNNDAGPDFSNARVRFDNSEEWAGNVEIHVKASDWYHHNHHTDINYQNIILHVVGVNDSSAKRADGTPIPQVCVYPPRGFYERYAALAEKIDAPRCLPMIPEIPALNRRDWIDTLGIERMQAKAEYIRHLLEANGGDWQQSIFILIARALGFGLNSLPFELLAKSLPLNFLMRHRDNQLQIEAMVFGQAGFLDPSVIPTDSYYQLLCREYAFLQKKYGLAPIKPGLWKYMRTRPLNFPHRRLAILASMICSGMQFLDVFLEAGGNTDKLSSLFEFEASDYWKTHFNFGQESTTPLPISLSAGSVRVILINTAAPFYYAYGAVTADPDIAEKGIDLWEELYPEKNSVVGLWSGAGLAPVNAMESQALLQLSREYCEKGRCLECRFGHYLLRKSFA